MKQKLDHALPTNTYLQPKNSGNLEYVHRISMSPARKLLLKEMLKWNIRLHKVALIEDIVPKAI